MVKESVRKCSHCGNNGHNSRTCNGGKACLMLFGVRIATADREEVMKKSLSMGNLGEHSCCGGVHDAGYLSDGQIHSEKGKFAPGRKRGDHISNL